MLHRRLLCVAALSAAAVLVTRVPCASEYLFSWDSVNFALGLERIDLARHQPHPPGYLAYIGAGRLMRFGASENTALVRANIAMSILAAVVLWWFAMDVAGSARAAAVAWVIVLTSPLHWFYSVVAEVYVAETTVTLLIAASAWYAALDPADRRRAWLLAVMVNVAALWKLTAVLLMAPLIILTVIRMPSPSRRAFGAAMVLGCACVLIAFAATAGLQNLWELSEAQFSGPASESLLARFRLRALNRSVRDLAYASFAAVGAGTLLALPLRLPPAVRDESRLFMTPWMLPYALMCLCVHFPKPGYALPLLPPIAVWVARGFDRASHMRLIAAIALVAGVNAAQFLAVTPWPRRATGEGIRYALKTPAQRLRTELNALMWASLYTVRHNDALLRWFEAASSAACPVSPSAVLVSPGSPVTWRHVMFYLPHRMAIRVPGPGETLLLSTERDFRDSDGGNVIVTARCAVLAGDQFDFAAPPGGLQTVLRDDHRMAWTTAPFTLRVGRSGRLLEISP
jgi:4-amino-4-deoxy-L-arabinose transferase-like glycosyltransferase